MEETNEKRKGPTPSPNRKMFSKEYQPSGEAKRQGKLRKQQQREAYKQMGLMMFEKMTQLGSIDLAINMAHEQAEEGQLKWLIELIKIMKPNEQQQAQIINAMNVQKVYVTKEEEKQVNDHIDGVING